MKVTWQEDDITKGVHVCRAYAPDKSRSVIAFQRVENEGPRYCVYNIVTHTAEPPLTKQALADYLNANGYVPDALLTL